MRCKELIEKIQMGDKAGALKLVREHMRACADSQLRSTERRTRARAQSGSVQAAQTPTPQLLRA